MSSIRAKIVQTIRQQKMEARRAVEEGLKQEGDLREHQIGDEARETTGSSGGDSPVKGGEVKAKAQSPKKEGGRSRKKVQPNRKTSKI